MSSGKRWLAAGAGVALSAMLLILALRRVDGRELLEVLASARWWLVPPFLLALFAYYWVKTVRWAYLLRPVTAVTPGRLLAPVMIGYAAGALLPMQLGEIVRAWLGAHRLNIRMLASLMSIALERVFDLLSILLLAALTFTATKTSSAWLGSAIYLLAAGAAAGLILFLVFVFRTEQCLSLFEYLLKGLPLRIRERTLEQMRAAAAGLSALRSPSSIAILLLLSVLQWILMFGCIWLSLFAMNLQLGPVAAALTTVFTVIGISLPNSPGYVGSIQLAFTLALQPFEVAPTEAVAASLFFHVLAYVSVVLSGLVLLPVMGVSLRDVSRSIETASESDHPFATVSAGKRLTEENLR